MKQVMAVGLMLCGLVMAGCSSTTNVTELPTVTAAEPLQALVTQLAQRQQQAQQRLQQSELAWFAPKQLEQATDALAEAGKHFAKIAADPTQLHQSIGVFSRRSRYQACLDGLSDAELALDKAEQVRHDSVQLLAPAFANREVLQSLATPEHYPDEYQALERELRRLVALIADDRSERAQRQMTELLPQQVRLETDTVRLLYLRPQQAAVYDLEEIDIDDAAPLSFAVAQARLFALEQLIEQQPRQIDSIKLLVQQVTVEANHTKQIGATVQQLQQADERQLEGYLLSIEQLLTQLAGQLAQTSQQQLTVTEQLKLLVNQHAQATAAAAQVTVKAVPVSATGVVAGSVR